MKDLIKLPNNTLYKNRFEIKSETSNRLYVIAQRKSDGGLTCSCLGWIFNRNCKHIKTIEPLLKLNGNEKGLLE